jgi:transposase
MKLNVAELTRLDAQLTAGEIAKEAIPVLQEALRHYAHCRYRRGASAASSERLRGRSRPTVTKKGHGRNGAEDFVGAERIEVEHRDLNAGDACPGPHCGGKLYLTSTPARNVEFKAAPPIAATVYERCVLRCATCLETFTAPLPTDANGGKYHPSVDAVVAVMRYALGMPHHRLAQWQTWAGVPMPASTQFERVETMANAVFPIYQQLELIAANRPLLQSDDTGARILVLKAENKSRGAHERTGIFTTGIVARGLDAALPTIVLYASGRRHAGENVDQLLTKRDGGSGDVIHMADASSMAPRFPHRIPVNCHAHGRRQFVEIYPAFPEHCERVLEDIATIYQHDDATRGLDPQARLVYHQQHSAPVLKSLREWIDEQFHERLVEPNSRLGKAFAYLKNHWPGLTRFLRVPGVPLDNNATEREIKPAQRHRKNSLFYKTETGAAVGDVLMSAIRTCVANRIDPVAYLTAVAANAAKVRGAPEAWLPWTYQQTLN